MNLVHEKGMYGEEMRTNFEECEEVLVERDENERVTCIV